MRKVLLGSVFAAAVTAVAANYSFKGTTDKNPLEYTAGDTMAFTLTLVDKDAANATVTDLAGKNIELRWTLAGDQGVLDGDTTASGTTTTNSNSRCRTIRVPPPASSRSRKGPIRRAADSSAPSTATDSVPRRCRTPRTC